MPYWGRIHWLCFVAMLRGAEAELVPSRVVAICAKLQPHLLSLVVAGWKMVNRTIRRAGTDD